MKILLINKFHYMRGGSETYHFALADALRAKGHEVIFFAMQDEKNIECAQSEYFVSNVDYNGKNSIVNKINSVRNFFYSKPAAERIEMLIKKEKPDIAHIGLIHRQITFSVVEVLKKYNIPVVMTMHDLIFACPNYTMLVNGNVCSRCLEGKAFNCVKNKCVKGSFSKSLLAAHEKKYLLKKGYYDLIDLYITECVFYKKLLERSKVTKSRIIHKTNFLPISQKFEFNAEYGDYVLYFGRFSKEKGIMTLLKAHKENDCRYRLVLVGAGPMKNEITNYIKENGLTNIELPGAIYGEKMEEIIEGARVIVTPSEWYENCPYSVLQSLAKGKIEVASNIGGLPELIENEKTGFLFHTGDPKELADRITLVMNMDKSEYEKMSKKICETAKKKYHWEQYADMIISEYDHLIKNDNRVGEES